MPPQTAVILWILILLALIVPAVASMRLLPPPRATSVPRSSPTIVLPNDDNFTNP
jgi:hypothetical protein